MERKKTAFSVFRHREFAVIWAAAAVSNIGNWMEGVAQGWSVIEQTKDNPVQSAFLTELLSVADFGPVLLFALIAGVISDRVNRKVWLFCLQATACVLGATLAVIGYMGLLTPGRVIALTFAEGVVWAMNGPVWMSVVPQLVPRDELEYAIAANSLQFNLARLIGPVLAGFVITASSVNLAFALNAMTFVPVLLALAWLPNVPPAKNTRAESLAQDMLTGLRFTWQDRGTRRLALMCITFMFLSAPLQGLLAVYASRVLGGGSALYGGMLACVGMGSVLGAISLGRIPQYYPRHHLIPLSMTLFSFFALLYSFSNKTWMSLPLLFFCGIFWLLSINPSNTATQLLATDEIRGRVMSVLMICTQGAAPLGHLCAGALVHVISLQHTLHYMFGALLIASIVFLFFREPAIDRAPVQTVRSPTLFAAVREAITAEQHWPESSTESVRIPRPGSVP